MKFTVSGIFTLFLLFAHFMAQAQLIPYAGVSVGYASSRLEVDPELSENTEMLPSLAVGAQVEWLDNPIIGMTTDIDYWRAGAIIDGAELYLHQVSMAQQLALFVPMISKTWEVYLLGGPQMSYQYSNPGTTGISSLNLSEDGYNEWIFGWRYGLGVDYEFRDFRLFFTAEYLTDSGEQYRTSTPQNLSIKNRSFLFSLGYLYEF